MAFDLSSPVAKLAFEMALRNQQAIDSGSQFDAQSRAAVSQALAAGNDPLSSYENIYRQYVDPAEAQRKAQAQAFNAYLIGLPELMAQSAKEMSRSSGGSSTVMTGNLSNYETPAERLQRLMYQFLPSRSATPQTTTTTSTSTKPSSQTIQARRL